MPVTYAPPKSRPTDILREEPYVFRATQRAALAEGTLDFVTRISGDALRHYSEPVSRQSPSMAERFADLADRWQAETGHLSLVRKMVAHPAYLAIIGLGPEAIPLILWELRRSPAHWFVALQAITGLNPIRPEHAGDIEAMAGDCLKWGEEQALI